MSRTVFGVALSACVFAWACSGSDSEPPFTPAPTDPPPATMPTAVTNGNQPAPGSNETGDDDDGDGDEADASASADAGAAKDAAPSPKDAGAGGDAGSVACAKESEPNDGEAQQLPRSLCGTLTAGDVDRFYIEGRRDEPIAIAFSATGETQVTLKTNAGLSQSFLGKSFTTTVKPGDRRLVLEVGPAKAPASYQLSFERK